MTDNLVGFLFFNFFVFNFFYPTPRGDYARPAYLPRPIRRGSRILPGSLHIPLAPRWTSGVRSPMPTLLTVGGACNLTAFRGVPHFDTEGTATGGATRGAHGRLGQWVRRPTYALLAVSTSMGGLRLDTSHSQRLNSGKPLDTGRCGWWCPIVVNRDTPDQHARSREEKLSPWRTGATQLPALERTPSRVAGQLRRSPDPVPEILPGDSVGDQSGTRAGPAWKYEKKEDYRLWPTNRKAIWYMSDWNILKNE